MEGKAMTLTRAQAAIIQKDVLKTVKQLIECLEKHRIDPIIGEVALVLLAGTSAGHSMRPLTDVLVPTLYHGWEAGVAADED